MIDASERKATRFRRSVLLITTSVAVFAVAPAYGQDRVGPDAAGTKNGYQQFAYNVPGKIEPEQGPLTRVAVPPVSDPIVDAKPDPVTVLVLQSALVARQCYDGAVDGVWNEATRQALRRTTRQLRLTVGTRWPSAELLDAILKPEGGDCTAAGNERDAGPEAESSDIRTGTLPVTASLPVPGRVLKRDDRATGDLTADLAFVTSVQAALVARGCYEDAIDGSWSPAVQKSLATFSRKSGVDTAVDEGLVTKILATPQVVCQPQAEKPPAVVDKKRRIRRHVARGSIERKKKCDNPQAADNKIESVGRASPIQTTQRQRAGRLRPTDWPLIPAKPL